MYNFIVNVIVQVLMKHFTTMNSQIIPLLCLTVSYTPCPFLCPSYWYTVQIY